MHICIIVKKEYTNMKTNDKQSEFIGIRITKEMKEKLSELAWQDRRSLASYIKLVLEKHIEKLGG